MPNGSFTLQINIDQLYFLRVIFLQYNGKELEHGENSILYRYELYDNLIDTKYIVNVYKTGSITLQPKKDGPLVKELLSKLSNFKNSNYDKSILFPASLFGHPRFISECGHQNSQLNIDYNSKKVLCPDCQNNVKFVLGYPTLKRFTLDTSIAIDGIADMKLNFLDGSEVFVPSVLEEELLDMSKGSKGSKDKSRIGSDQIKKLAGNNTFTVKKIDTENKPSDKKLRDMIFINCCKNNRSALITSDEIQSNIAQSEGIPVIFHNKGKS